MGKLTIYTRVDRLIWLILTILVSTNCWTSFLGNKDCLNKISQSNGRWFSYKLFGYLHKKEIVERFTIDMLIDDF